MPPAEKLSMLEMRLRRCNEQIVKYQEELVRPRIQVSEASMSLINHCKTTTDYMVPSVWGSVEKREHPYDPATDNACCSVM